MIRENDKRTLVEACREAFALSRELGRLDDKIRDTLRMVERALFDIGIRRVLRARLDAESSLGWSQRRGRWRLVIVDNHPDGNTIGVLDASREERAEVLGSDALAQILQQAGIM